MNNHLLTKGLVWVMVMMASVINMVAFAASTADSATMNNSSADLTSECGIAGYTSAPQVKDLYQLNDKVFGYEDFVLPVKQSFYELEMQHYHKQRQLIDNVIWQNYLAEESKRQGKSVEDLATSLIPPYRASEAEIEVFYEGNKARMPGKFEDVKGRIEQFLAQQHALMMRENVLTKLKAEQHFKLLIDMPLAPLVTINTDGYPVKGNPKGKVEIVEFADYQCSHCQRAAHVVNSLVETYDNIRVVLIDFPVNRSGISRRVALGGVCAAEQEKFWEYHDLAFASQASLSHDSPAELAENLGFDMTLFTDCLQSGRADSAVTTAKREGQRLGVTATPSFFVNGRKVHAHGSLEKALSEAIDLSL